MRNGTNTSILSEILSSARPDAPLGELQEWTERLLDWILRQRATTLENLGTDRARVARLKLIVQFLKQRSELSEKVQATLHAAIQRTSAQALFVEAGIPKGVGLLSEAAHRLSKRFLPEPPSERDWSDLLGTAIGSGDDSDWLVHLPNELIDELRALCEAMDPDTLTAVRQSMLDALLILSAQTYGIGVHPDLRKRSPELPVRALPEFRLAQRAEAFAQRRRTHGARDPSVLSAAQEVLDEISSCRSRIQGIYDHLEAYGISVELVYQLERMNACLDRSEKLVKLLAPGTPNGLPLSKDLLDFLLGLARAAGSDRSLRSLIGANLRLLSRKIVQRAGDTGEQLIARNTAEYLRLLSQAAGGGVVTAFTAIAKFALSSLKVAPILEALSASFNYAGSFVLMHFLGFKLATKQPAMTAAALSAKLGSEGLALRGFADEVARITRSQFASVLGNLGAVIPAALALDLAHRWWFGAPTLDPKTAEYAIRSLDPLRTLTIPYAAFTGFLLWLASVGSGWIENAFVYHRTQEGLASHPRLIRLLGKERAASWSKLLSAQISGIASNILLGFFLGFAPVIGKFLGLPIDVRHVTLSTASLTLGASALWERTDLAELVISASVGIGLIGLLNFGVSFAFAFTVALRSRETGRIHLRAVGRAVMRKFTAEPWRFFFPSRERGATSSES